MTTLAHLQQIFWQSVRTSPGPEEIDSCFVTRGSLTGRARIAIYRTAYWVRQVEVLRELFPSVVAALGDGPFAREASRYLQHHPSSGWAIEGIGAGFPKWLAAAGTVADAAALDWARWCVMVAPDSEPFDPRACAPEALLDAVIQVGSYVEVVEGAGGAVAVWRSSGAVFEAPISAREAAVVRASKTGLTFGAWCEALSTDSTAEQLVQVLERWSARGWCVRSVT